MVCHLGDVAGVMLTMLTGNDRIGIGIRSLPIGFGILGGAVIALVLIPITKGNIQAIMILFTVSLSQGLMKLGLHGGQAIMTAGTGSVAIANPDNINVVYGPVSLASIGVGGVIIPCSIIAQIICPDDLIATITAITLAIRYVGGAIGFTVYYNVFYKDVFRNMTAMGTQVLVGELGYTQGLGRGDLSYLTNLVTAIAEARYADFEYLARRAMWHESIFGEYTYEEFTDPIIRGAQFAFADAYRWPYFISIAFGGSCFILSFFLGDLKPFLDEHIAVVM